MKKNKNDNLIPQAHKLTVEEQSKGGKKSAESRREKKTVNKILTDFMNATVEETPQLKELADTLGISSDKSLKELFVLKCIINNLEKGNLYDLEQLMQMLGEDTTKNSGVLESILSAVRGIDND